MPADCMGKDNCTVQATNNLFGDPYVGTFKQFVLTPTCGPAPAALFSDNVVSGCETQKMVLKCPPNKKITGGTFRYGKWDDNKCDRTGATKKEMTYALPKYCIGQNTCNVEANNGLYGDPNPNVFKQATFTADCN